MKSVRFNRFISLLLCALMILTFLPNNALAAEGDYHTVTFYGWGNNKLDEQQVLEGQDAKPPVDIPTPDGNQFVGWSGNYTAVMKNEDIYAQFKAKHTVTFLGGESSTDVLKTEVVLDGGFATAPDDKATPAGQKFVGWVPSDFGNVTADLNVTAQYAPLRDYTVTFLGGADGITVLGTENVKELQSATEPVDKGIPDPDTQVFDGWDSEAYLSVTGDELNITIHAIYSLIEDSKMQFGLRAPVVTGFTVTYSNGDATGTPPAAQTVDPGTVLSVPTPTGLTAPNNSLVFYYWKDTATNEIYKLGSTITVTKNTELVAIWDKGWHLNLSVGSGGSAYLVTSAAPVYPVTTPNQLYPTYQDITINAVPNTGWTLKGFYKNKGGAGELTNYVYKGNGIYSLTISASNNTNMVYVMFEQVSNRNLHGVDYEIGYYFGVTGYAPNDSTDYAEHNVVTVLGQNSMNWPGHQFLGWSLSSWLRTVDYVPGATFDMPDHDVTLYSVWEEVYTVTYNANNGSGLTTTDSNLANNSNYLVKDNTFAAAAGQRFVKWNTKAGGNGTNYVPGNTFTITGDKTLYAIWESIDYSVSYSANGGSGSVPTGGSSYHVGDRVTVLFTPAPTRSGYNFLGWATTSDATTATYTAGGTKSFTMGAGNVTLYAVWDAIEYTVSYNANGGSGSVPTGGNSYHVGDRVTVLFTPAPTRSGRDFLGWATTSGATTATYTAGGTEFFTMGAGNVTLYAVWDTVKYTVSYNANGGSGSVPTSGSSYHAGDLVTVLFTPAPTRIGYDFLGWATTSGATTAAYTAGGTKSFNMGAGNVTLYAVWDAIEYTVSYNANGGSGSVPTGGSSYHVQDRVTVLFTPAPTRSGYNFLGWATTSGATTATYAAGGMGSFTMGAGNVTLYAVWDAIEYTVSYSANGGSGSVPTGGSSYHVQDTVTVLFTPAPTRSGYDFLGWATTSGATTATYTAGGTEFFTMGAGNVTLYAVWDAIEYAVSYNANDGSGSVPTGGSSYHVGDHITVLFSPAPTRSGYDFLGWSTSSSATTAEFASGGVAVFTMGTENVTLYAVWALHNYAVFYSANNGTGPVPSDVTPYVMGSPITVLYDPLPTRTGYDFLGWSTSASATEATFVDGGTATLAMGTADITLYAVWSLHGYSVSYSANGGTGSVPNDAKTYVMDNPVTVLYDPLPTRAGYTFLGWATSGSATEAAFVLGGSTTLTMGTEDVTLYAVWSLNHYSISYVPNDSAAFPANNPNPTSYTVLDDTIHLANPTRTGYTFDHWDPAGVVEQGSTGDKTFTAYWTADTYTIHYVLNGGTNDANNPKTYTAASDTINLAPATRPGYKFLGWYVGTTPNSTIAAGSTGDKTFTAKWSDAIVYKITYTMNNGTNHWRNPSVYTVTSDTITLRDPSRIGYDFAGWTPSGVIPHGSTGEKAFTANWTPKTYSISYELLGGTNAPGNPSSYTIETATINLASPTKPGYTFLGWFLSSGTIPQGSVGDRLFVAVWSLPIRYNITYNLNGGVNASGNPSRYWVISDAITLAAPTRAGYTFAGWTPEGVIPKGSTGDKAFTANWTPVAYSITYDLAGGSVTGNPETYTIETPTFTLNSPTRDFYTFAGWTPADATIEQGTTGNLSFTANWTPIAYAITYTLNGGENAAGNPASYTVETPTFTLSDPTRDYYTFAGWAPSETTIAQGSTGELTFTASWMPITYDINYDMAGGVNAPTNPATYTVETPDFTLANPTRAGYKFEGWSPADTLIETGSHGDLRFVARWSAPNIYAITYDLAGGVNAPANPATFTVESDTITLDVPTRLGYTFLGWTPQGTIPKGTTGDKAFTALWSAPLVYGITYVMNGGVNAAGNPATYTVESAAITLAAPTRAGYAFTGWTPAGGIPAGSTGARVFTATWSAPIEYDITYVLGGGINAAQNPATYNVTSGLITLLNPTRTGYDFLGWTPTDTIPAASTGTRTFTATWSQPHVHTVTYFVSGGTQAGLDGATPFAIYRDVAYGAPVPIPNDPAQAEYTFDGWSGEIPATMPDEDIVFYGTLTRSPVLREIIANDKTPLAAPTWSLLNLILAALTAIGGGSIISMLFKKRNETGSRRNTIFSLLTVVPAAGAIVAFIMTQMLSGSMVFADRWSLLMGGITVVQGVFASLSLFGGKGA